MYQLLKTALYVIILSCGAVPVIAQDKIYKTDGSVLESKVKQVGVKAIVFKRFNNQDGPEYTILKKEVVKIVYENGTTDMFNQREPDDREEGLVHSKTSGHVKKGTKKYGNNFIAVTPAAYTVAMDGSMNDVGVGISYERLLDKKGHIGLNLPVLMCFTSNRDFNNYRYYYGGNNPSYSGNYHSFFFEPSLKFYPASSREAVRYSLGASLFCSLGTEPSAVYSYNNYYGSGTPTEGTYQYSIIGFMLANSVNIMAGNHVYMAIDLAAGVPVSDNRHANKDGLEFLLGPFLQFGFKLGYRY